MEDQDLFLRLLQLSFFPFLSWMAFALLKSSAVLLLAQACDFDGDVLYNQLEISRVVLKQMYVYKIAQASLRVFGQYEHTLYLA